MFAGPHDKVLNANTASEVVRLKPEFIFRTHKIDVLGPSVANLLAEQYYPLGQGAFAHWLPLATPLTVTADNTAQLIKTSEQIKSRYQLASVAQWHVQNRTASWREKISLVLFYSGATCYYKAPWRDYR